MVQSAGRGLGVPHKNIGVLFRNQNRDLRVRARVELRVLQIAMLPGFNLC